MPGALSPILHMVDTGSKGPKFLPLTGKGQIQEVEDSFSGTGLLGPGSKNHCPGLSLQRGVTRWCQAHGQRPHPESHTPAVRSCGWAQIHHSLGVPGLSSLGATKTSSSSLSLPTDWTLFMCLLVYSSWGPKPQRSKTKSGEGEMTCPRSSLERTGQALPGAGLGGIH